MLIDTAHMYYNEREIGTELAKLMAAGTIARDELFVVTKIAHPNTDVGHKCCNYVEDPDLDAYAHAKDDIAACLHRLGLSAVDLLLIHW